jgi:outer membrane beta-barrel protein
VEGLLEANKSDFKAIPTKDFSRPKSQQQKIEYLGVQSQNFYSDLGIVQRNYMPKMGRSLLSGGLNLLPSDAFYRTFGLSLKGSYHFSETWGAEFFGSFFTSSSREEVRKLETVQHLDVNNLVYIKQYYGLNLYFNSMYGKTSLIGRRVIPFEIYQTIGIGKIRTQNYESTAFQVGLGDMFSLTRSTVFRVDLSWAFYSTKNYLNQLQPANSIFLTISYGRFFPEPNYR